MIEKEEKAKACYDCIHYMACLRNGEYMPSLCSFYEDKAGYRKQIEGKWIFKRTYYEADECNCSVCGQLMTTAKGVRMNYCPNCGAKMKGGAERE